MVAFRMQPGRTDLNSARARAPAAFACVLLLTACSIEPPAPPPAVTKPDITLQQVTLRHWRNASLTLEGKAAELTYVRQTSDLAARELSLHAADGAEVHVAQAAGNAKTKSAVGSGGARLQRADGLTASAHSFVFGTDEGGAQWFSTDASVEVRGPGMVTKASSLRADLPSQHLRFSGGVRTNLSRE